jgi:hypothetical protein
MRYAYREPLAVLGIAVAVAMHFGLGPRFLVLNTAQHLSGIEQIDKCAQWSGISPEDQHFFTALGFLLNRFDRLLDCRVVEK